LTGAAQETFLNNIGLLLILPCFKAERPGVGFSTTIVTRKLSWLVITTTALIVFSALMGRSVLFHQ